MSKTLRRVWITTQLWYQGNRRLGGRMWYQHIDFGDGLTTARWSAGDAYLRTMSFLSFLQESDLITEDDLVVDIGCNGGLFSLVAAQRCKQVFGVEIDRSFARQAKFVKRWWRSQGKRVDNVTFVQGDMTSPFTWTWSRRQPSCLLARSCTTRC